MIMLNTLRLAVTTWDGTSHYIKAYDIENKAWMKEEYKNIDGEYQWVLTKFETTVSASKFEIYSDNYLGHGKSFKKMAAEDVRKLLFENGVPDSALLSY